MAVHWWVRYKWGFYRSFLFLNNFNLQSGCQNQSRNFQQDYILSFFRVFDVVVVRAAVNNIRHRKMYVCVSTIQFLPCRRIMKASKDNKINGKYKRNLYRVFHWHGLLSLSHFMFLKLKKNKKLVAIGVYFGNEHKVKIFISSFALI